MNLSYAAPASLSEALALLAERGPDCTILAGGMSVVPALKKGLLAGTVHRQHQGDWGSRMVRRWTESNDRLTIGALVRHREVETSPLVAKHFPTLRALEEKLASVQIRNHGTLAGNLCAAEPWSDPPCLMAALDARLTVVCATRSAPGRCGRLDLRRGRNAAPAATSSSCRSIFRSRAKASALAMRRVAATAGTRSSARVRRCARHARRKRQRGRRARVRRRRGIEAATDEGGGGDAGWASPRCRTGRRDRAPVRACSRVAFRTSGAARHYKRQVAGVLARRAIADAVENARSRRIAA